MSNWKEELEFGVKTLPNEPGVYKFYNSKNTVIYVGKAKNLRNRVGSYFLKLEDRDYKTQTLVSEIRRFEFIVTHSEHDALLLENNLIKEFQPKYNILLRDDKSYPYICITNEPFPRVFAMRNVKADKNTYFGPFTSVKNMHYTLQTIKELYPIRTCTLAMTEENVAKGKYSLCLEYHLKNCLGPCTGLQSHKSYNEMIDQVKYILKGNFKEVRQNLEKKMFEAAEKLEFEKAAFFKKKIEFLRSYQAKSLIASSKTTDLEAYTIVSTEFNAYVNFIKIENGCVVQAESVHIKKKLNEPNTEILAFAIVEFRNRYGSENKKILTNLELDIEFPDVEIVVPKSGDQKKIIEWSLKNLLYFKKDKEAVADEYKSKKDKNYTLFQLKSDLNLPKSPEHIECFDNSNIQGTNPVAAMVCFKGGRPSKKDYRHYKINTVQGPDDFASMFEVVTRRYTTVLEQDMPLPDLIVIDGGKGQLNAAVDALKGLGLYPKIPIVSIAKRLEEIYFPNDQHPLHINKKSKSLALLQRVRDEAHRFGIEFHRNLRSKGAIKTQLAEIEGFGDITVKKLLKAYKSLDAIVQVPDSELIALIGQKRLGALKAFLETKKQVLAPENQV
jgi:excinuclease ABC subunit C